MTTDQPPAGGERPDDGARGRLAAAQAELLAALVAGGPAPAGFDPARLRTQAAALAAKRRRVARRVWPELAHALGDRFDPLFDDYAARHPRPAEGARADVRAFAADLRARGLLPAGLVPSPLRRLLRRITRR
ncbi:hypothetical protein FHU37_004976 [Allostreptomyces psammosilenae]|uniref:SCO6045-like C-terminal domain-containing protein n=1 Tax=Allostreptomyces psammosilenae TaxID=1892865 RepID=A0A853A1D1_9ACTN|nr:hypothetical protein [Allostreptomyces psammosilenae]NYI07947.1 hypothetical protein [Allostreptomyces psammosilenae]